MSRFIWFKKLIILLTIFLVMLFSSFFTKEFVAQW